MRRMIRDVPFEVTPDQAVDRFVAVFEVDGRRSPPALRSSYDVLLYQLEDPPHELLLTNALTGVSWTVKLDK